MSSGGRLILETLVIGDDQQILVPEDRYARMRNCWFIPSVRALTRWLERCGFSQIECVDVDWTSQPNNALPDGAVHKAWSIRWIPTTCAGRLKAIQHAQRRWWHISLVSSVRL